MALENLGYTALYADSVATALRLYETFPHNTVAILMSHAQVSSCFPYGSSISSSSPEEDSDGAPELCIKDRHRRRTGIPLWKILTFYFWAEEKHPLGARWTLSPEPFNSLVVSTSPSPSPSSTSSRQGQGQTQPSSNNTYLGYSVQPSCGRHAFVEPQYRPLRPGMPRAYILAKHISYFSPGPSSAWPLSFYNRLVRQVDVQLVGAIGTNLIGMSREELEGVPDRLPEAIENLGVGDREGGMLEQNEFLEELGHSSVLIGIGRPGS